MGCEGIPASCDQPLWSRHRDRFPVTQRWVYMNHAAVAPLCGPAAEAMVRLAREVEAAGTANSLQWSETYENIRTSAALLLSANRDEIAIVKNTSEGVATIQMGFPWRAGDRIVAFREEFPANIYPWQRLESRGVGIEWLSVTDSLDRVDQAAAGARLLAISYVNYLSGQRVDLEALGEICHRRRCFFFVDAIQGLGVFPIDVRRARIDALSADGHKWLLGPEGCGILYVRREWQDSIEPMEFGWTNVASYNDYASRDLTLRPDAGRYECGTLNTIGCYGLRAALEFVLEIGVEHIGPQVQALADSIASGVGGRGYEVLGVRTPVTGAGIVSFRKPDIDARMLTHKLRQRGIIVATRQGWVRASPHFYISPADVDTLVGALD